MVRANGEFATAEVQEMSEIKTIAIIDCLILETMLVNTVNFQTPRVGQTSKSVKYARTK